MTKITLSLFLMLFSCVVFAQEKDNYSITFSSDNLEAAVLKIEAETNYKFYFQEEWMSAYDHLSLKQEFKDQPIEAILSYVFSDTNLNFLILNSDVILSKNILIHTDFPGLVSRNSQETEVNVNNAPLFYKEFETDENEIVQSNTTKKQEKEALKFIGKENKNVAQNKFFTITGMVSSSKTKEGIPNVYLRTENTKYSAVSNINGYYSLRLPVGYNKLLVSSVGFNTIEQEIVMYSNGEVNFSLLESVTELGEVVVSTHRNEIIKETAVGVTTVDVEGVKEIPMVLGERDIVKVALTMPGIKSAGEGAQGFNVRGGKADQNLTLLDNALVYNPFHMFGFFTAINPYTISTVDIYKASIPSEYGGRLSSVMNIKTKEGNYDKFEGEAGIGPVTGNVKMSTPLFNKNASLMVGARATYSGWILKMLDDKDLKNSDASFYDGIVKYSHKINENNIVSATGYYSKDKFNISADSLYEYSNRVASIHWKHVINSKNNFNLQLSNSEYKFGINYRNNPGTNSDFGFKINETQLKLKFNYYLNKKHKLFYGISSKLYNLNPGYLHPSDIETSIESVDLEQKKGLESGLFLQDEFTVNEKLTVNGGLRFSLFNAMGPATQYFYEDGLPKSNSTVTGSEVYDDNEFYKTYSGLEYRLSSRYALKEDLALKFSFDTNYQYIHMLTTNTTQSPTDTWTLSDLNIKPQASQQVSLGIFKTLEDDMYEVSIEGYYKKMKNVLDYRVGAEMFLNETIEQEIVPAEGKAYGVEFLLKKNLGKFNGWLSYTYSRAFLRTTSQFDDEIINNNQYYPANFDKPHDVSLIVNYKLTKRYSFSGNFVYQTGRPITYPIGTYQFDGNQYTAYTDRNKFRIPDYYRLDLGINIEGNHKIQKLAHSFWNISVYNVLGRNNPYSIYFVNEDNKVKAYKTSIFAIPVPTITYNFKF
ncbi:TonB-dependent Receptor Plug Domain [Pustulibacterium marinum]|uniref:TonB-dependent Receptor Plug Domain n=1 Tax=Pustulibacterium marinum TaxID=1224947 RepID=A0A1I7EVU6_9FLAO|nr:TonB-dependent receptor [Pustulibacterium marinum]SFU28041.1 TonB-dependent Receptor Plug Domain [Pustulibacterium marinum]